MTIAFSSLAIVVILLALLGIWVAVIFRTVRQGSRLVVTAALKRFASDFGLKFWTHLSPYHTDLAKLTGRGKDAISNVLLRKLGDAEMVWFEVLVSGGGMARHEHRVAIRKPGYSFPKFAMAKKSISSSISLWMEMKRFPSGDRALDGRLNLYGDDAEAVHKLFSASLCEKIARADFAPSLVIRGNDDWLLFNVKAFRSSYGWPSVQLVTQDLRTFLSWMAKAIAAAELFFPIESETTSFMVPSAEGLLVRGAGRDKGDILLILAALALWLLALVPFEIFEGDLDPVLAGILFAAAITVTGEVVRRLYKKAMARTTDSLARGL